MFPEITRDDIFRLETERLWLRWPRAADADAIARYAGDADVALMTPAIPHPYAPHDASQFILRARTRNAAGDGLTLALTLKRNPAELVGVIGVWSAQHRGSAELGYWLGRPFWGMGLMTEAGLSFIDLVFSLTSVAEIVAGALPTNGRSRRVQQKLGFEECGQRRVSAPARGGEMLIENAVLKRGAAHTLFGARRPKFASS